MYILGFCSLGFTTLEAVEALKGAGVSWGEGE